MEPSRRAWRPARARRPNNAWSRQGCIRAPPLAMEPAERDAGQGPAGEPAASLPVHTFPSAARNAGPCTRMC